jgi:hypothetical protein
MCSHTIKVGKPIFTCLAALGHLGKSHVVGSTRLLKNNQTVTVAQDPYRVHLTGLPVDAPDSPITTIAIECDDEPRQDTNFVRINKPRVV